MTNRRLINCCRISLFLCLIGLISTVSQADSAGEVDNAAKPSMHHALTTPPNRASDASFDKRLPPVLPGEELSDSGRTVKIWSSAGPIPDSIHPNTVCQTGDSNCANSANSGLEGIGVIIDQRRRTKPAKTSDSWAR